jgi:hypothetical protein
MKRYAPCIPQTADPGSMCERTDGEYYLAADVDARIDLLERALKSCSVLIKKECESQRKLADLGDEVLAEIDKALSL